ncbi:hypothetical protein FB451DRAFT_1405966 [Mycena latifolia]|nr:hypothetical protein FB451DRAFT_1405966 [Mycena latifolia]
MHATFRIAELVDMICHEVGPPNEPESRRALAVLARTSRAFLEPALDILWECSTIQQLFINCMPEDLWEEVDIMMLMDLNVLSSNVPDAGCCLGTYQPVRPTPWLYAPPPASLFPNLHTLLFHHSGDKIPDFTPFLGPKVSRISLSDFCGGPQLSLLPHIARKSPTLKHLGIGSNRNAHVDRQVRTISTLVRSLQELESLDVHQLDGGTTLRHLGRLPNFKSLTLHNLPSLDSEIPGNDMFLTLEQLVPHWERIHSIITFLDMSGRSPLRQIHTTLAECPSTTSLRLLTVGIDSDLVPADAELWTMQPLLRFVNLTTVDLMSPIGFYLDDAIVSAMAHAWPLLQELSLSSLEPATVRRVTLASLRALAKFCPKLEVIQLAFDASSVPPAEDTLTPPTRQSTLYRLHVENSTIERRIAVARFLSGIFPNLVVIPTNLEHLEDQFPPGAFIMHHR